MIIVWSNSKHTQSPTRCIGAEVTDLCPEGTKADRRFALVIAAGSGESRPRFINLHMFLGTVESSLEECLIEVGQSELRSSDSEPGVNVSQITPTSAWPRHGQNHYQRYRVARLRGLFWGLERAALRVGGLERHRVSGRSRQCALQACRRRRGRWRIGRR